MLNLNRNWIASTALLVAGLTLTQASIAPRQSHAIVAIASGGTAVPALIVIGAGAAVFGGSVGLMKYCGSGFHGGGTGKCSRGVTIVSIFSFLPMFWSIPTVLVGLVFLDESGAPTPNFKPISPELAQEAGIPAREMRAFNKPNQLDRTNSVSESIARGFAENNITDAESGMAYSHDEWTEAHARGLISTDAFNALTKLSDYAYKKAQAQAQEQAAN
jgi:hypothetical protein